MAWSRLWRFGLAAAFAVVNGQQTGQHPDWPRWCGKVYQPGYPNFDPGGQTLPPPLVPGPPLLHVLFQPRFSLYLDSEEYGEFVVNAAFSQYHGTPWPNTTSSSKWANKLIFSINLAEDDDPLVQNTVPVNTTGNIFRFKLAGLKPSLTPIKVVLYGAPESGTPAWTATTTLLYLPSKPTGSVTRIDNLRGGLYFSNPSTNHTFTPFFPYGFYASYDGFIRENNTALIDAYAGLGLNAMTPLTTFHDAAAILDYMASDTDVRIMHSLRDIYRNLTAIETNLPPAASSPALFAYWSADEPDGWQDPFALPQNAYALIRSMDPYHPVAVTLNCADYYYAEYSAPADFLMADVYPIGINATYSKWGTECNATYGDCGCDNCEGTVQDVVERLEGWKRYEGRLGRWGKTVVFNPQAFHGEDYWLRDPGVEESWAMVLLAVNHGAKGVVSWVWPTSEVLAGAHGRLARVVAEGEVVGFVVGGEGPRGVEVDTRSGSEVVDVAGWVKGGKMLVSVVNGGYVDVEGVEVLVPEATVIESTPWGDVKWKLERGRLSVPLLPALATSLVVLDLRG